MKADELREEIDDWRITSVIRRGPNVIEIHDKPISNDTFPPMIWLRLRGIPPS